MSCAKARLSVVVDHRVAAVLDDDDRAGEALAARAGPRSGRAAFCCGAEMRRWRRSCRVRAVLVDVVVGEVVGPDGRGRVARRGGRPRRAPRGGARSTRSRSSPTPPARHTWTPLIATSSASGSNAARVVPDGREDPAPVGVAAEDGGLEQVAAGDGPADLDGVLRRSPPGRPRSRCRARRPRRPPRARGPGRRTPACTAAVERRARPAGRRTRRSPAAGPCRWSTCSRRSRSGRTSPGSRPAARGRSSSGVGAGVGGEDDEHRRQTRREHAGALGHAADGPAVTHDDDRSWHGVGRHDRRRRRRVPPPVESAEAAASTRRAASPSAAARR